MKKSQAVEYFGSQQAIADALGLGKAAVSLWGENEIPIPRQAQLELLSRGKLKSDPIPPYEADPKRNPHKKNKKKRNSRRSKAA